MNLILVPQYPVANRYTDWYFWYLPRMYIKHFDFVRVVLPKNFVRIEHELDETCFSPVRESINFELGQVENYMSISDDELEQSVLLLCDLSFPGIFPNVLFHRKPKKCFAICHATALNRYDYFAKDRSSKYGCEKSISKLFDRVFVATNYHKKKLGWKNCEVVGLPFIHFDKYVVQQKRTIDIIAPCRILPQKITRKCEERILQDLGIKVLHKVYPNYREYYRVLSKSKILLSTAKEETFGYQILDAIECGCVPLAPNSLSYPELLPKDYLFNDEVELVDKIRLVLSGKLQAPKRALNIDLCNSFFDNTSRIMMES